MVIQLEVEQSKAFKDEVCQGGLMWLQGFQAQLPTDALSFIRRKILARQHVQDGLCGFRGQAFELFFFVLPDLRF